MSERIFQFDDRDIEELRRVIALSRRPVDPQRRDERDDGRGDLYSLSPILNTSAEDVAAGRLIEWYGADADGVLYGRKPRYPGLTRLAMVPWTIPSGSQGYCIRTPGIQCRVWYPGAVAGQRFTCADGWGVYPAVGQFHVDSVIDASWVYASIIPDNRGRVIVVRGNVQLGSFCNLIINNTGAGWTATLGRDPLNADWNIPGQVRWLFDADPDPAPEAWYPPTVAPHGIFEYYDGAYSMNALASSHYSAEKYSDIGVKLNRAGVLLIDDDIEATVLDPGSLLIGPDWNPVPSTYTWWRSLACGNEPGLFAESPTSLFDDIGGG